MLIEMNDAELRESQRRILAGQLANIAGIAKDYGFVVTVEQRPLEPLAMGNYETVFSVRDDLPHVKEKMEAERLAKLAAAE